MKHASLVVSLMYFKFLMTLILTGDNNKSHMIGTLYVRPIPRSENGPGFTYPKNVNYQNPHFTDEQLMPQPCEGMESIQTWVI